MATKGKMMFEEERRALAQAVEITYGRKNTNTAGGNISFKTTGEDGKEYIIMTPTLMSEVYHGRLSPAQILVLEGDTGEYITGEGTVTREFNLHLACYNTVPEVKCVFHAHAPGGMFWSTSNFDMPNVTENTQKIGYIKNLPYAPATSHELAVVVENELKENTPTLPKQYLFNSHGNLILTTADDGIEALNKALSIMDASEWNAEIAYKQTVFQKLGIMDGYYSNGKKIGTVEDLIHQKPIYNRDKDLSGD
ncbi:class II aldolase/adducin family protein [Aerococcus urinae]|uniref:class II aldolase/adducin family protein n=1 Tax=Aerococcus urinae TaxID=1376 RepID=UPI00254E34FA|nr:class II aldolase/adducin family protein [Aerococcus urinae]MDK6371097.1 class II aldolase/adducin family protein [Aerococcus urinae]